METKEEKIAQFQKELEISKRTTTLFVLLYILITPILIKCLCWTFASITVFRYVMYGITSVFSLYAVYMLRKVMNMRKAYKALHKNIQNKKEQLIYLKKDYLSMESQMFIRDSKNLRETERYRIDCKEKTPEKVIKEREDEIEDNEIQLQVYKNCTERTLWQYLGSLKWVRTIQIT